MEKIDDIAKWFINETTPDPLKLQKLLYLAQGISYCINDCELFDEYNPIDIKFEIPKFSQETYRVLEYVRDNYAKYDSKYLEKLTHSQDPWIYARTGLDPDERNDKVIPKTIISDYFTSVMFQPDESEWTI